MQWGFNMSGSTLFSRNLKGQERLEGHILKEKKKKEKKKLLTWHVIFGKNILQTKRRSKDFLK